MKTFFIQWPNETFTILSAVSYYDLLWQADEEGDPFTAHFCEVKHIHILQNAPGDDFQIDSPSDVELQNAEWFTFGEFDYIGPRTGAPWRKDWIVKAECPIKICNQAE